MKFSEESVEGIREMIKGGEMRFYGQKVGGLWKGERKREEEEEGEEEVEEIKTAIRDIVRMDIRSLSQKKKGGKGGGGGGGKREGEEEEKQYYSFRFDEAKVEVEYVGSCCSCVVTHVGLFCESEE